MRGPWRLRPLSAFAIIVLAILAALRLDAWWEGRRGPGVVAARQTTPPARAEEEVRNLERRRLRALVDADSAVMRALHAFDFELINPDGERYSRADYLGELESGLLDYVAWEPGEITVRSYMGVAIARYQDREFEVRYDGEVVARGRYRHTNVYEMRDGRWQIVWSHASGAE